MSQPQHHHNQSNTTITQNLKPTPTKFLSFPPIHIAKILCDTFQSTNYQKNKASPNKTNHIRLITIGPSHYCEKVRWGLDLLEHDSDNPTYYTEDAHPPLCHAFATLEASNGKASMTPMVLFNEDITNSDTNTNKESTTKQKKCLTDSTNILKHFCPFLYSNTVNNDETTLSCKDNNIESLENYLDQNLGASIRCLIYYEYFNNPKYHPYIIKSLTSNTSMIESSLFSIMFGIKKYGIRSNMSRSLNINQDTAQISQDTIKSVFDDISNRLLLSSSKSDDSTQPEEYILGTKNGFTAVDLTFASLASVLLLPKELETISFDETQLTPRLHSLRNELLNTVAGQHVFKMYEKHRFTLNSSSSSSSSQLKNGTTATTTTTTTNPLTNKIVILKTLQRNRFPYVAAFTTTATLAAAIASVCIMKNNNKSKLE